MIRYIRGNLLEAEVEALVNTVNTVGVMGKGIALMFKKAYPKNFQRYAEACNVNQVEVGRMFVTECNELIGPKWIVNFPTKLHWRNPAQMKWVEDGLRDLVRFIQQHKVASIALPSLGCGNGGLDWQDVRLCIEATLAGLKAVDVVVYEPGAP